MDLFLVSGASARFSNREGLTGAAAAATRHSTTDLLRQQSKRSTVTLLDQAKQKSKFLTGKRKQALKKKEQALTKSKRGGGGGSSPDICVRLPSVRDHQGRRPLKSKSYPRADQQQPSEGATPPSTSGASSSEVSGEEEEEEEGEEERFFGANSSKEAPFSGADSPWYQMMTSASSHKSSMGPQPDSSKRSQLKAVLGGGSLGRRKKKKVRYAKTTSFQRVVSPSSSSSSASSSGPSWRPPEAAAAEGASSKTAPPRISDLMVQRMQLKLGRIKTPETLVGSEMAGNCLNPLDEDLRGSSAEAPSDSRRILIPLATERRTVDTLSDSHHGGFYLNHEAKGYHHLRNPEEALDRIAIGEVGPLMIDPNLDLDLEEAPVNETPEPGKPPVLLAAVGEARLPSPDQLEGTAMEEEEEEESGKEERGGVLKEEEGEQGGEPEVNSIEADFQKRAELQEEAGFAVPEVLPPPPSSSSPPPPPSSCSIPMSNCSSKSPEGDEEEEVAGGLEGFPQPDDSASSSLFGSYKDLLAAIDMLDKETLGPSYSGRSPSLMTTTMAAGKGLLLSAMSSSAGSPSMEEGPTGSGQRRNGSRPKGPTPKMSNLLSYLDDVDKDEQGTDVSLGSKSREHTKVSELALLSSQKLAEQVVNLQYSVEEKERGIVVLRQALEHQRKLSANFSSRFQKELKQRLHTQKGEYEAAITRHQNFIDQLIEDKKKLCERCDNLAKESKNSEARFRDTIKNVEQRHTAEIKRLKSLNESSNRLKQEKWVDEKTRRIKEQTVRGLEPEIQRMMSRHAQELSDLEGERQRQLTIQEKEMHQRHLQHVKELREDWEQEHLEGIQRERHAWTQRHDQQVGDMVRQHSVEVERLHEQLRRERLRNSDERSHYEKEAEQIRRIANDRANSEIERVREEEEARRNLMQKKHAGEVLALKEAESADRGEWEREFRQKIGEEWKEREAALRSKLKSERDEELDNAVNRLEAEVARGRREIEQEYQERIRRLKEKFEEELAEANGEIETLKQKCNKLRDNMGKKDEDAIVMSAVLKQKEVTLEEMQQVNERLEAERVDVRKSVRAEFASALDSLTLERTNLLAQISDLRLKLAEVQSERESAEKRWRCQAEEEAERIHAKVQRAIERKDEALVELRRNYERALEQCNHLETMLQLQTKNAYIRNLKNI